MKTDTTELRKQISIFIPLPEWRALRAEAARQKIPMTELCRRWMSPGMATLNPVQEISTAAAKFNREQAPSERRFTRGEGAA